MTCFNYKQMQQEKIYSQNPDFKVLISIGTELKVSLHF